LVHKDADLRAEEPLHGTAQAPQRIFQTRQRTAQSRQRTAQPHRHAEAGPKYTVFRPKMLILSFHRTLEG
jgi:hypothetical protein